MKKPFLNLLLQASSVIFVTALFHGCWPCHTITIENGPLPEKALAFVPYQDGETYKIGHSKGLVINYRATRETTDGWTECTECCKYEYHYQINTIRLVPDYPVFELYFEISNPDTAFINCYGSAGKYNFLIPASEMQSEYFESEDSLKLGDIFYKDVFKLKSSYWSHQDSIFADSMYYNYEFGILKLIMSNGEYYEITD